MTIEFSSSGHSGILKPFNSNYIEMRISPRPLLRSSQNTYFIGFPTSENSLHLLSVTLSSFGSRFVSLCSSFSEVSTNSRMFSFAYSRTCYLVHIRASYTVAVCIPGWRPQVSRGGGRGLQNIWRPKNFRIFLTLSPLVTLTNQLILFLLSAFWWPPPPHPLRTSYISPQGRGNPRLTRLGFEGEAGFDWADWQSFTFRSLLSSFSLTSSLRPFADSFVSPLSMYRAAT